MSNKPNNIFAFNWEENCGLDLKLIEWEDKVSKNELNETVLELSQALFSAFAELRKIYKILSEGRPGIDHSFYQYRFEMFAHNHFLGIATWRVLKILKIGYPKTHELIQKKNAILIKKIRKFRDSLEHQTEIGKRKNPPSFLNNLTDKGYESEQNILPYKNIETLLNEVMDSLENVYKK